MNSRKFWLSTLPVLILLALATSYGTVEAIHARLLSWGESTWQGYALLRAEPVAPPCTLVERGAIGIQKLTEKPEKKANARALEEAKSNAADDFLDDLLGDDDDQVNTAAAAAAEKRCRKEHAAYQLNRARRVGWLRVFVTANAISAAMMAWGIAYLRHLLVLLLLICAAVTTARRSHIALRVAYTLPTERISQAGQLLANLALFGSCFVKWRVDITSQLAVQNAALPVLWMWGFAVLSAINLRHLLRPAAQLSNKRDGDQSAVVSGLLAIPLYAIMSLLSGFYFYVVEQHPAGLAIYLQQVTEHAQLYMHVGLYVWAGMLLKRSALPALCFEVLRCWRMPAEYFAFVVVAVAAVPTAYSGASGIFVIAAGAVIFQELRRAGARQKLALAATALSGSLGVVLSPCLLVVIIASLNKQVTTDQLFAWGWKVYLLTAGLFLAAMLILRKYHSNAKTAEVSRHKDQATSPDESGDLQLALRGLLPYLLVSGAALAAYAGSLDMQLGEHTAPVMLPVLLCALLAYEGLAPKSQVATNSQSAPPKVLRNIADATDETSEHIGALLTLMSLSICLGGVVVRGNWMSAVPESFGSVWLTMGVLVVVLVLIGMVMDPYGAVILVSAAVADIAYRNGIDPVQFWMVVLVAFELGYLTPPVALNHLLTRHVVGSLPVPERPEGKASFYSRHEDIVLPLLVMGTALLIVAFGPLMWS